MINHATGNFHLGVAEDTASEAAQRSVIVVVHTTAAGIDVAKEGVVVRGHAAPVVGEGVGSSNAGVVADAIDGSVDTGGKSLISVAVGRLATDNTGSHLDIRVLCDVAVGATTEDGTADVGLTGHGIGIHQRIGSGVVWHGLFDDDAADFDEGVVGVGHVIVIFML